MASVIRRDVRAGLLTAVDSNDSAGTCSGRLTLYQNLSALLTKLADERALVSRMDMPPMWVLGMRDAVN